LKFQALESLINVNGAFCLVEKKKEERERGEKERISRRLSSAYMIHNKVGPTVRGATHMGQVHIVFPLDLNFCLDLRIGLVPLLVWNIHS
jgi:hypothetical protein